MAAKTLRDYQQKAVDVTHKKLSQGIKAQLWAMATGAGKTFTAVKAIAPFKKRMWITHESGLLEQSGSAMLKEIHPELDLEMMIDTYGGLTDYLAAARKHDMFSDSSDNDILKNIGIIKAGAFDIEADIVLASAQTLHRRLDKMQPDMFDAIVFDECHLSLADSFSKGVKFFDPKLLLGLTATPHRTDGRSLSDLFDEITFQYSISDAINEGYLCELDALAIKSTTNLDKVRTTAGEFNQKDLRETVDTDIRNKLLLDKYYQYAKGKQNIIFGVDIEHCKNIHKIFTDAGEKAEILVSNEEITPDRKGVINRFKRNETTHLINVMLCTAGFDSPNIQCITMARPTKSLTLFMQILGRGTRTLPGTIDGIKNPIERIKAIKGSNKPHCTILDIVDTTAHHKLVNTWALEKHLPAEERVYVTSARRSELMAIQERRKFLAVTKKDARVNLMPLPKVTLSMSLAMKDPASEKQYFYLAKLGYPTEGVEYTKGDANRLISNHEATDKQRGFLRFKGFDTSNGVTIAEAKLAFEQLAKDDAATKVKVEMDKISPIGGLL